VSADTTGIDLAPDATGTQIVDATRAVLRDAFPLAELTRSEPPPGLADRRRARAADLGWTGCGLPEALGGAGFAVTEEALLFRELGRGLVSPGVMATLLAALVVADADPDRARAFADGTRRAGLAVDGPGRLLLIDARPGDDAVRIDGPQVTLIPAAALADRTPMESVDPTLTLHAVDRTATATVRTAPLGDRARLLLAAQMVGLAEASCAMAVAHAKLRQQFGRPIGAFQAVAHPCADMEVRARAADAQLAFAAVAARDGRADAPAQVLSALLVAADAAFRNATVTIRVLGGMGYSSESGAHLFLKRAMVLREAAGGERAIRRALLDGPPPA
jgi:alkylation response protein AidB-like acyl-CoA dehydrogenase